MYKVNINNFSAQELQQLLQDLVKISRCLNWSDKKILHHIDFRSNAQLHCCFEFNYNIAKWVGFSEKTVRNSKKRLLKLNLIEKIKIRIGRFLKTAYILTDLGSIVLHYLKKRFTTSNIIKEIGRIIYNKFLRSIFKNILGTDGRGSGKVNSNLAKNSDNNGNFDPNNKHPPSLTDKLWEKKRKLYRELMKKGTKFSEEMVKYYKLDEE